MMYMPVIDILKPQGRELFEEYRKSEKQPLAYEVCWDEYTPEVEACMKRIVDGGSKLWVNSLWPSLCGGLNDDRAFRGETEEVYGRLLDMGATIIQTDRPELLIRYLESKDAAGNDTIMKKSAVLYRRPLRGGDGWLRAELLCGDLQRAPAQCRRRCERRRLGAAASGDRLADPLPRFRHFRSSGGVPQPASGSSRGASRLRLHRRRTRRRGRGGRICGGVLQERPFPTARLGAFLAFGGTLASEQGLGCQICPHLLLGPVPRSGERRAVLVLHAPYRSQGPACAGRKLSAGGRPHSDDVPRRARRAHGRFQRGPDERKLCRAARFETVVSTLAIWPNSAMPRPAPRTASIPTARRSGASTISS